VIDRTIQPKIIVDERTNPDIAYFGASCGQSC